MRNTKVARRFDDKYTAVSESGCWLWTGADKSKGYGCFYKDHKRKLAHRCSWEIHNGPIPKGLNVCHKCDVPCCVNPEHLFLGTQKDNMRDCTDKQRRNTAKGAASYNTSLNEEDVIAMRALYKCHRFTNREIAAMFDIKDTCFSNIIKYRNWTTL